jgi:protein-S-isoprenylcysteine O-methyltransferase Ste14
MTKEEKNDRLFVKALLAVLTIPVIFSGLIPVALSIVDPWRGVGYQRVGVSVIVIGLIVLLWCVRDFYVAGKGTLAPWAPPKKLVIVGLYRYTRNPMYIGVLIIVGGIALIRASPFVALYLVFFAVLFHFRVILNEENWLAENFSDEWVKYKREVSRWMPKITPYHEGS